MLSGSCLRLSTRLYQVYEAVILVLSGDHFAIPLKQIPVEKETIKDEPGRLIFSSFPLSKVHCSCSGGIITHLPMAVEFR
jgi:hypothetical protein